MSYNLNDKVTIIKRCTNFGGKEIDVNEEATIIEVFGFNHRYTIISDKGVNIIGISSKYFKHKNYDRY
jgi:acetolactate synthase small subunit